MDNDVFLLYSNHQNPESIKGEINQSLTFSVNIEYKKR